MKSPTLLLKTLLVTVCLACGMNANAYDIEYDGFYFNIIGDNEVEVTYKDTNYNSYSGDLVIPSWVRDADNNVYDVVAIGANAFKNSGQLTHLNIPSSVKRCSGEPFNGCTQLRAIYIQDLKAWCEIDFRGLSSNNPLNLAHNLFVNGQPVGDAIIPEGTTVIKSMAFVSCTNLTSITIPNSVTRIEWGSLTACHNLETVRLGSGITEIEDHAFNYSESIRTIFCDATTPPVIGGDEAFSSDVYSNATLVVPESSLNAYHTADYWKYFSRISAKAFDFYADGFYFIYEGPDNVGVTWQSTAGNTYSGVVIIPETVTYQGTTYTVTKVEANAFTRCPNLTSVILPPTITTVNYSFYYNEADGMIEITCLAIDPPYGMTQMTADQYANVIVNVPKNSLAAYQADEGWGQFANLRAMSYDLERDNIFYEITGDNEVMVTRKDGNSYTYYYSIDIPATITVGYVTYDVTAINDRAFYECSNLSAVTLPSSVKTIGNYAFFQCSSLTEINLGSVETIGSFSFGSCTSLANVKLNGYLKSIQGTSFAYCTALRNYQRYAVEDVPGLTYEFVNGVIFTKNAADKTLVTYPCGKINTSYTVPDGTVYIGEHAFRNNANIKTVNLPTSLRGIKEYAFYFCTKITNIEVPKGVTEIDIYAFSGCTALQQVTLPSTLTSLGGAAFHNDAALTTIKTKAKTPPVCGTVVERTITLTPFDQAHFTSSMLSVPTGYKTAYKAANIWKLFSTIREDDSLVEPEYTLGDVNGDGTVNITDVTTLISCVMSENTSNIVVEAADMNGDGNINITDVTMLINAVMSN